VYLNQQRWDGAEVPEIAFKPLVDPALAKIKADIAKAAPMPQEVRQRLAQLRTRS
jgi:hypothetical protein